MSKLVKELKKQREEAQEKVKILTIKLTEALKVTFLTCKFCGKRSRVDSCSGIDLKWYDENTGSPCGGFWTHWKYCWKCPKCNHIYHNEFKDDRKYWELYPAFLENVEYLS